MVLSFWVPKTWLKQPPLLPYTMELEALALPPKLIARPVAQCGLQRAALGLPDGSYEIAQGNS